MRDNQELISPKTPNLLLDHIHHKWCCNLSLCLDSSMLVDATSSCTSHVGLCLVLPPHHSRTSRQRKPLPPNKLQTRLLNFAAASMQMDRQGSYADDQLNDRLEKPAGRPPTRASSCTLPTLSPAPLSTVSRLRSLARASRARDSSISI